MNSRTRDALDLFSGARGWDVAAESLGWTTYGVENWKPARATAEAAGFRHTMSKDVRFVHTAPGQFDLHLASPVCTTFSPAGTGAGRRAMADVLAAVRGVAEGKPIGLFDLDPVTALVLEPLRIALEGLPRVIAWEQSDRVLPIWAACASVLRDVGYSAVVEVLNAKNYGVPADRKRAVLMARRDNKDVLLPSSHYGRWADKPYITMGETLGWPDGAYVVSNYGQGGDPRNRGRRTAAQPAFAVTGRADRNKVHFPDGAVRNLTSAEAATLQTFPDDYPFRGTKAEVGQQIGNAVPPMLAHAILTELTP